MTHSFAEIPIADLIVPAGDRPVDESTVAGLVNSIKEVGLLNPLIVTPYVPKHAPHGTGKFVIVAGRHRHAACVNLGHDVIRCQIKRSQDAHRDLRLIEIDENLMRLPLSPALLAKLTAERASLVEDRAKRESANMAGSSRIGRRGGSSKGDKGGAAEVARLMGKPERTVQRAAARGKKISAENLIRISGTFLDNGRDLDHLARLSHAEQVQVIETVERDEAAPVAKLGRAHQNVVHRGRGGKLVGVGIGSEGTIPIDPDDLRHKLRLAPKHGGKVIVRRPRALARKAIAEYQSKTPPEEMADKRAALAIANIRAIADYARKQARAVTPATVADMRQAFAELTDILPSIAPKLAEAKI